jgi:hypothetical protein
MSMHNYDLEGGGLYHQRTHMVQHEQINMPFLTCFLTEPDVPPLVGLLLHRQKAVHQKHILVEMVVLRPLSSKTSVICNPKGDRQEHGRD